MNTPADKPDLPALFPACIASFQVDSTMRTHELSTYDDTDMRTYGRMCADEREAWARADERRKARAQWEAELMPVAWMRVHTTPGTPYGPAEHDIDIHIGEDMPDDGNAWTPLAAIPKD